MNRMQLFTLFEDLAIETLKPINLPFNIIVNLDIFFESIMDYFLTPLSVSLYEVLNLV